mmetsp:Transcript_3451/g.8589  ORF Transcript_3451/g.8589 Transcript_3451/m.8589 type:complete len:316 (-) Transcript_3451:113-1060(-)
MAHNSPVEAGIYIYNSFIHGVSAEEVAIRQLGRRNFKTAPAALQYAVDCLGDSAKATWGNPSEIDGRVSPCSTSCGDDHDGVDAGRTRTPQSNHSSVPSLVDAEEWAQEEGGASSVVINSQPSQTWARVVSAAGQISQRPSHDAQVRTSPTPPSARAGKLKYWVHFYLDPAMLDRSFCLCKKVIGTNGQNMKVINDSTGAKLRLRGQGSGHTEQETGCEAGAPLMLAVTTPMSDPQRFLDAVNQSMDLLEAIEAKFRRQRGEDESRHHVRIGSLSPEARVWLESNKRAQILLGLGSFPSNRPTAWSRRGGKASWR